MFENWDRRLELECDGCHEVHMIPAADGLPVTGHQQYWCVHCNKNQMHVETVIPGGVLYCCMEEQEVLEYGRQG
jgi:hypothetical protein